MTRKVIQISYGTALANSPDFTSSDEHLFALTDDGKIFVLNRPSDPGNPNHSWEEVAVIPQD